MKTLLIVLTLAGSAVADPHVYHWPERFLTTESGPIEAEVEFDIRSGLLTINKWLDDSGPQGPLYLRPQTVLLQPYRQIYDETQTRYPGITGSFFSAYHNRNRTILQTLSGDLAFFDVSTMLRDFEVDGANRMESFRVGISYHGSGLTTSLGEWQIPEPTTAKGLLWLAMFVVTQCRELFRAIL